MIEYFLFGSIFNFVYFGFNLHIYVLESILKEIDYIEKNYPSLLDQDMTSQFEEIKTNFSESVKKPYDMSLLNIFIDLILFPIYFFTLIYSLLNSLFVGRRI